MQRRNTPSVIHGRIPVCEAVGVEDTFSSGNVVTASVVTKNTPRKTTGLIHEYEKTPKLKSTKLGMRGGSVSQSIKLGDFVVDWWHQPPSRELKVNDRVYITIKVTANGRIKDQGDRKATVTAISSIGWKDQDRVISIMTDNGL